VERAGSRHLAESYCGFDEVAVVRARRGTPNPIALELLIARSERQVVVGTYADLRILLSIRSIFRVARIDIDLDRVLNPRVRTAQSDMRIRDLHQDKQCLAPPQRAHLRLNAIGSVDFLGRTDFRSGIPNTVDVAINLGRNFGFGNRHTTAAQL